MVKISLWIVIMKLFTCFIVQKVTIVVMYVMYTIHILGFE